MAPSEPKDIDGRVVISIQHDSAVDTCMRPLTEIFVWPFFQTRAADLAGLVGVHQHDGGMPGTLSLGTHHLYEGSPTSILETFIQATFSGCPIRQEIPLSVLLRLGTPAHVLWAQILKSDRLIALPQDARLFVQEVLPLVSYLTVALPNLPHRLLASIAATLLTRERGLLARELLFRPTQIARILDGVCAREGSEVQQAQVDPNGEIGIGQVWLCLNRGRQDHVPLFSLALDRAGLDSPLHLPVPLHLDHADGGDRETVACELPTGMIGKAKTVVARSRLVAWVARGLPILDTTKEGLEGFVHPMQNILRHMRADLLVLWPDLVPDLGERTALLDKADGIIACMLFAPLWIVEVGMLFARIPGVFPLLQGGIIQFATTRELPFQQLGLSGRWVESVLEGFHTFFLLL